MKDDKVKPQATARAQRLASALRENLKRRKVQARGRTSPHGDEVGRDEAASSPRGKPEPRRGDC